jgi:hypothetical protein
VIVTCSVLLCLGSWPRGDDDDHTGPDSCRLCTSGLDRRRTEVRFTHVWSKQYFCKQLGAFTPRVVGFGPSGVRVAGTTSDHALSRDSVILQGTHGHHKNTRCTSRWNQSDSLVLSQPFNFHFLYEKRICKNETWYEFLTSAYVNISMESCRHSCMSV